MKTLKSKDILSNMREELNEISSLKPLQTTDLESARFNQLIWRAQESLNQLGLVVK